MGWNGDGANILLQYRNYMATLESNSTPLNFVTGSVAKNIGSKVDDKHNIPKYHQ